MLFDMLRIGRRLGLSVRALAFLMFIQLVSLCFEVVAVAMLLPIFQIVRAGQVGAVDKLGGRFWEIAREVSAYVGIPITLGLLLSISFASILLRQLFSYLNTRYSMAVQVRTANKLLQKAFNQFLFARTSLQDNTGVGDVTTILRSDLSRGLDALFTIPSAGTAVVQLTVYLGGLFMLSWSMTVLSLGMLLVAIILSRSQLSKVKEYGEAFSRTNRALSEFMLERIRHARLIRLSGTEKAESNAIYRLSRRNSDAMFRQSMISARLALASEPIAVGFAYLVLYVGGYALGFSLERLGVFAVILIRLMRIMQGNITQYTRVLGRMPSLERLDEYLIETAQAREPKGGDRVFQQLDDAITFENVSYSYTSSRVPALKNINVAIPAQRMSALIGPSGAGKSTFIDMLPRLRLPSTGEIKFDGIPIAEFSTQSLRAGIAFVPQQPQIFNCTPAEHIRYGKEDATDAEVHEAARLAGALEFIEHLPEGFNTLLGEGGKKLSGGQRQRLDIARALVRSAPILILDEPTSALDAEAESAFRDVLQRLRVETKLTIIVIAHRLSTIAHADRIIVMDKGSVTATGTHAELMAAGGWYAEAYRIQHGRSDGIRTQVRRTTAV